ncbi:MAG: hypothetical protein RI897_3980 [Verrucomicrobiota bacterium]
MLLGLGGVGLGGVPLVGADAAGGRNRFPRMVQEFYVEQVRLAEWRRVERLGALRTGEEAEQYVRDVRARVRECFGPFPEKTPLNARITGVVRREGYRIEKLIFESRPGFLVTGNVYVPEGVGGRFPGVVATCGHSTNGKAEGAYQSFCQGLVRQGYVVLIFDPLGQGERLQYPGAEAGSRVGVGVREHLLAGNQQFLVGEFIGAWRAWDGIRALDYLLTREEVDPAHVGVTGNSGGGTMTTWLCGLEERWTMAAPSCFVTTFRHNLENELPADTEQCPPGAIALGLDHEDFIAAMAPKPVILLGKEKDFFDVRGTREAFERLKRLYRLLGAEDRIGFYAGPTAHGFSRENREAMYGWFNRWTGREQLSPEDDIVLEEDVVLQCTIEGQVSALGSRSVFSFTREKAEKLKLERPVLGADELRDRVQEALRLPAREGMPYFRVLRSHRDNGYPLPFATPYAVETEPGVQALVYRLGQERLEAAPPRVSGPALLYVAHHSADVELREESRIREWMASHGGGVLYACDVRGIGESKPNTCGENMFLHPYGSDYFYAIHGLMLGRPYVGQKTHDVLSVLDWLMACGHREVHLAGKGWGSVPAAFAALLSEHVKDVQLWERLESYHALAVEEDCGWPLSVMLPGVLGQFDLPEVYAAAMGRGRGRAD